MTPAVYRYPVRIVDEQIIDMPDGATILSVATRAGSRVLQGVGSHEEVHLWALVDPDAPLRPRRLRVAGTGHPLPEAEGLEFLGSVQLSAGQLVFHVFEATDPSP